MRVKISAAARRDLAEIDTFSAETFGEDVADAYSRGLRDVLALLSDVPFAGEARPEYGNQSRSKTYRSHRIFYRIEGQTVFVQRILHHSRDVRRHLQP